MGIQITLYGQVFNETELDPWEENEKLARKNMEFVKKSNIFCKKWAVD